MVRITLTIARAASDKLVEKSLHDQIDANQAAFDPECHRLEEPTAFRLDHPRSSKEEHPIYLIQPDIKTVHSRSLVSAKQLYMHFLFDALPIFHTLTHRKPELFPRKASAPMVWSYPEPLTTLTKEQRAHTWDLLGKLAKELDWDLSSSKTPGWKPTTNGLCTMESDRPMNHIGMLGSGSTITTSRTLVKSLAKAVRTGDKLSQQWYSFRLAVVWLHELSHAVMNAVLPCKGHDEILLGPTARTSELGFEVEARLFGGQFQLFPDNMSIFGGEPTFKSWPDWETVSTYRQGGTNVETREAPKEMARGLDVAWKVEWKYVESMFEEGFWATGSAASRLAKLRPEKRMGVTTKWGQGTVAPTDWIELRRDLKEEGFALEDSGLVVEGRK